MIPRVQAVIVALAGAALVAACGSSAGAGTSSQRAATVTRTVTQSRSQTTTASSTPTSQSTTTSSTATTAAASGSQCVASDLALTSLGGSGATGHLLLAFGLRNTSNHSCRTGGYPGVLFLDGAGKGLPTTPDHTTDDFFGHTVLRALTVAPGQLVSFRIGVTDVGSGGGDGGCAKAAGLQVIAPDDTATLRITRDIFECGGTVSVSPVQAGTAALH